MKLLLILAAYGQLDFILELLRTPSSADRRGLQRVQRRLPRGFDRALEAGESKVWQDPEFY